MVVFFVAASEPRQSFVVVLSLVRFFVAAVGCFFCWLASLLLSVVFVGGQRRSVVGATSEFFWLLARCFFLLLLVVFADFALLYLLVFARNLAWLLSNCVHRDRAASI